MSNPFNPMGYNDPLSDGSVCLSFMGKGQGPGHWLTPNRLSGTVACSLAKSRCCPDWSVGEGHSNWARGGSTRRRGSSSFHGAASVAGLGADGESTEEWMMVSICFSALRIWLLCGCPLFQFSNVLGETGATGTAG